MILPLGGIPTEGTVFISEQAQDFAISEIINVDSIGLAYQYEPQEGFSGEDFVEITRTSSIGDGRIYEKLLTQISIVVP